MNKQQLESKLRGISHEDLRVIVTVVQLPTGALEVITNYEKLPDKIKYLWNAYDDDLRLKTCPTIRLVDAIII